MLFIIVINFKAHKVKVQEIKKKTKKKKNIFIKQKREYIIYIDKMPLENKKRNYKISPKCYLLALGGSAFWLSWEAGTFLA